jgi:hypothetical protein
MEPIGVLAVAVGVVCFVLIAVVSMRRQERRRRRVSQAGAFIPMPHRARDGDDCDVSGDAADG